jgi:hypothetical protein
MVFSGTTTPFNDTLWHLFWAPSLSFTVLKKRKRETKTDAEIVEVGSHPVMNFAIACDPHTHLPLVTSKLAKIYFNALFMIDRSAFLHLQSTSNTLQVYDGKYRNKQRCLVFCSRGIIPRSGTFFVYIMKAHSLSYSYMYSHVCCDIDPQSITGFSSLLSSNRYRHLMEDFRKLLPHHKKEVKLDAKGKIQQV